MTTPPPILPSISSKVPGGNGETGNGGGGGGPNESSHNQTSNNHGGGPGPESPFGSNNTSGKGNNTVFYTGTAASGRRMGFNNRWGGIWESVLAAVALVVFACSA